LTHKNIYRSIILTLSILAGSFYYFLEPIVFEADGLGYFNVARRLIGEDVRWDYFRTIGYPIIILSLSFLKTFKILVFIQTICAICIPLILFETFSHQNEKIAFLSSLILIMSQIPFTYCSYIFTETFYLFFLVSGIYLFQRYIVKQKEKYISLTIIFFFLCFLIKPIAQFVCFFTLIILIFFFKYKQYIKSAKLFFCLFVLFSLTMSWFFNPAMDWGGGESFRQPHRNLFAKAYLTGIPKVNWSEISQKSKHDIFRVTAEAVKRAAKKDQMDPSTYKMLTKKDESLESIIFEMQNHPRLPYYNLIVDSNRSSVLWPYLFLAVKENPTYFIRIAIKSCFYSSPAKGKFLFQNEFATSAFYGGLNMWWLKNPFLVEPKITKENGIQSEMFFAGLNDFLFYYPQCWVPLSKDIYGRFQNNPSGLVDFAFQTRLYPYFTLFQGGLDMLYGAEAADEVFLGSVLELWNKYPLTLLRIPVHFYFLVSGISIHGGNGFINPTLDVSEFCISHTEHLPPTLQAEILKSVKKYNNLNLASFYKGFKNLVAYLSLYIFMITNFLFFILSGLMAAKNIRNPVFWLVIAILLNEFILISIFNFPNARYAQVINVLILYSFCFLSKIR